MQLQVAHLQRGFPWCTEGLLGVYLYHFGCDTEQAIQAVEERGRIPDSLVQNLSQPVGKSKQRFYSTLLRLVPLLHLHLSVLWLVSQCLYLPVPQAIRSVVVIIPCEARAYSMFHSVLFRCCVCVTHFVCRCNLVFARQVYTVICMYV